MIHGISFSAGSLILQERIPKLCSNANSYQDNPKKQVFRKSLSQDKTLKGLGFFPVVHNNSLTAEILQ